METGPNSRLCVKTLLAARRLVILNGKRKFSNARTGIFALPPKADQRDWKSRMSECPLPFSFPSNQSGIWYELLQFTKYCLARPINSEAY